MTTCLKQGTAGVTRFILITMVSYNRLKKGNYGSPPKEAAGRPPTPEGWARIPIWGRGNDYRLRGLQSELN